MPYRTPLYITHIWQTVCISNCAHIMCVCFAVCMRMNVFASKRTYIRTNKLCFCIRLTTTSWSFLCVVCYTPLHCSVFLLFCFALFYSIHGVYTCRCQYISSSSLCSVRYYVHLFVYHHQQQHQQKQQHNADKYKCHLK